MSSQTIVLKHFYYPEDDGTAIAFSNVLARLAADLPRNFLESSNEPH
jgi:hypothetical protein